MIAFILHRVLELQTEGEKIQSRKSWKNISMTSKYEKGWKDNWSFEEQQIIHDHQKGFFCQTIYVNINVACVKETHMATCKLQRMIKLTYW